MIKGNKSATKILSVIITALTVIIGALAAAIIINIVVCRIRNKPVNFFGYSFAVVQTPSMEPTIMTGDLIVFRTCNYSDVEKDNIIVFLAGEGFGKMQGQSIVHRVKDITDSGIVTKGDNNSHQDDDLVTEVNLLGLCTGHSHFWGAVFTVFSKYGIFIIIAIIAVPFVVGQIIKIVKLSKQSNGKTSVERGGLNGLSSDDAKNPSTADLEESDTDTGFDL